MFTCCVRMVRSPDEEDKMDSDCRWKKGQTNRAYIHGGQYDHNLQPPIFYINSGDSSDGDTIRHDISDVRNAMTSKPKLDPNSQLQKKSKLHNEKLPSFSALDRTKRPRIRKEETVMEEDSSSLGYEPLTFETFRSTSPPLAVIAPLSNPKTLSHTNVTSGQKTNPHSSLKTRRQKSSKTDTTSNPSVEHEEGEKRSSLHKHSQQSRLPKLTHQISISKEGAVSFQCKGLTNEGYCSDDEASELPRSSPSSADELPTKPLSLPRLAQRPSSLLLPVSEQHSRSPSRNSASTFQDDSSSAFDTDTFSLPKRLLRFEDSHMFQDKCCTDHGLSVHDSSFSHSGVGYGENHISDRTQDGGSDVVSDGNYVPESENNAVDNSHNPTNELIPPSTVKKIPPKKPKRKNPPSNVSTAASRDAIKTCLTSNDVTSSESARQSNADLSANVSTASADDVVTCVVSKDVTSQDHEGHSDVDLSHAEDDMFHTDDVVTCVASKDVTSQDHDGHSDVDLSHVEDDVFHTDDVVLLMPPQSFMDVDYAGFDSFDEVNGSLV